MRPTASAMVFAVAAVLGIAACSSSNDDSTGPATTATATTAATAATAATAGTTPASAAALTISGRAYSAATVTAGQPFTIANEDGFSHTVTDRDGAFDVKVAGNGTATLTIDEPGTYRIYCTIHPDMAGTITVD